MKEIYYIEDGKKKGPIALEDITNLSYDTLVWHEGLKDWTEATNIKELSDLIQKTPPPIPSESFLRTRNKYDINHPRDFEAMYVGLALLIIPIMLKLIGFFKVSTNQELLISNIFLLVIAISIRISVLGWVKRIALSQNRNIANWGIFAFIFPSLALIVIGLSRRLKFK